MTLEDMEALFDNIDEYIKFDRVENKRSNRPDLHAFLLLDSLCPGTTDMISAAEHDEFYLSVTPETVAKIITEEQIIELMRCGVRYSEDNGFCMFA